MHPPSALRPGCHRDYAITPLHNYTRDPRDTRREKVVTTPFGAPSGPFRIFKLASYQDAEIVFLPRHGPTHSFNPSEVRAVVVAVAVVVVVVVPVAVSPLD
jgi:5'-methylthioadenosine phosphorylase